MTKSQNKSTNNTITLVKVIERLEKTELDLEKAEKQLKIAKDCLLKVYNAPFNAKFSGNGYYILGQLLAEVNEALKRIEKIDKGVGV